jgi:hypothetical protein
LTETARTITRQTTSPDTWVVSWTNMANGDTGFPLQMPGSSDRSVQVTGEFGAGGTVNIIGSNDGVNYSVLTDPQGNALTFTSSKIEAITEATAYIKPYVANGDETTDVNVYILVKGQVV